MINHNHNFSVGPVIDPRGIIIDILWSELLTSQCHDRACVVTSTQWRNDVMTIAHMNVNDHQFIWQVARSMWSHCWTGSVLDVVPVTCRYPTVNWMPPILVTRNWKRTYRRVTSANMVSQGLYWGWVWNNLVRDVRKCGDIEETIILIN